MPDQVPDAVKKQRAATLARVGEEIQNEMLDKYIEEHTEENPVYVLCETYKNGISNGHTEHFIECDFETDRDRIGEIIPIAVTGRRGSVLLGKALS